VRALDFLGRGLPALETLGAPSPPLDDVMAGVSARACHGRRKPRYIALAPTTIPMTSPATNRTSPFYHGASLAEVWGIFAVSLATFIVLGIALPSGLGGLAVAQVVGLGLVPLALLHGRTHVPTALGLHAPAARHLAAAVLLGITLWYLNLRLWAPLMPALDASRELSQLHSQWSAPPLAATLVAVALVPAICEELVTRGLLARALARRYPAAVAVVVSAAVFSVMHLSLARTGPTLVLGIVAGALTLRAGSVFPAVVLHACNNAAALIIARRELPVLTDFMFQRSTTALVLALAGFCGGVVMMRKYPTM
jgi:sodium transport system permease protein